MNTFIKVLSSPWTHVALGLIFWIVPFLVLYFSGQILDPASCCVGVCAASGISCFDFGLTKFLFRRDCV